MTFAFGGRHSIQLSYASTARRITFCGLGCNSLIWCISDNFRLIPVILSRNLKFRRKEPLHMFVFVQYFSELIRVDYL
jgi:hypothetical protein